MSLKIAFKLKIHKTSSQIDHALVFFSPTPPEHTSNVPLILNTSTVHVSPQFYCMYDNEFDTYRTDTKFKSL